MKVLYWNWILHISWALLQVHQYRCWMEKYLLNTISSPLTSLLCRLQDIFMAICQVRRLICWIKDFLGHYSTSIDIFTYKYVKDLFRGIFQVRQHLCWMSQRATEGGPLSPQVKSNHIFSSELFFEIGKKIYP